MKTKPKKINTEDSIFISALYHELFNRILPTIRHDLVGEVSASLMRVSIMDRFLNKAELDTENLKSELKKIDQQLKSNIVSIRALSFLDNPAKHYDTPSNILFRSVQFISTPLATKNIQINVLPHEHPEVEMIETKPLLYALLCLFAYIEDNNFDDHTFNILQSPESIQLTLEPKNKHDSVPSFIRNTIVDKEMLIRFANLHLYEVIFDNELIIIKGIAKPN